MAGSIHERLELSDHNWLKSTQLVLPHNTDYSLWKLSKSCGSNLEL